MAVIGVDLGGTNVRAGKINDGKLTKLKRRLVPKTENPKEVINAVIETIEHVFDDEITAIGMGIPGLVDTKTGVVFDIQNIPSWKNVEIKKILEERFKVPVFIDNDANCFAFGEKQFGATKKYNNSIGLTLGTGMGVGVIVDSKLYSGRNSGAGELGMVSYRNKNYEAFCSGQFFQWRYKSTGEILMEKAINGDLNAQMAFNELGFHIANAIKLIQYTYDTEAIIIGGSVALAGKLYSSSMIQELLRTNKQSKLPEIRFSEMEHPAIKGAAALCL